MSVRVPALPRASVALILLWAAATGAADDGSRIVTDGAGRHVTLPSLPRRIISLAPNVTEMIIALEAGDRIVGVSDFCRIPEGSPAPERVGGLVNPDLERIVSLRPDLVVATTSGNYLEDADRITKLGISVYTLDTPSVGAVLSSMSDLGGILGDRGRGAELAAHLRRRLGTLSSRIAGRPRPRVLFVVWGEPILAPGGGTFLDDALALAGAESISSGSTTRWAEIGLEEIIAAAPEVILTVPDNRAFAMALREDPRWRTVPAVASARIHVVSDAIQQPGPGIVDGIEEVARILHPEENRPAL